jgi:integrase
VPYRSVNRTSSESSAPVQPLSIGDILARVRSRRSGLVPREEIEALGRRISKGALNKALFPSVKGERGTENQRRYWKGGKRQPAKTVLPSDVDLLLEYARKRRYPERNGVIVLLSFKAGLCACEIAGLKWEMVLGSDAVVGDQIVLAQGITKGGRGRTIPINAQLREALQLLHQSQGEPTDGHVVQSERRSGLNTQSVVNWFAAAYRELGLAGCSSHSGRRTFITTSARILAKTGGSLRDIQELAGHRALTTTERYIEGDREAQRRLIELL